MTRQRDTYFDWLKCVAIALVVFSHVYGGQAHIHTPWLQALYNFIISCNMPLFFAISGYFAYRVIEEVDTKRLLGSLRSYLQPWLVFVGLLLVGDVILYKYDGGGGKLSS